MLFIVIIFNYKVQKYLFKILKFLKCIKKIRLNIGSSVVITVKLIIITVK